jgi:predicted RNase H-like nuclease (RuvC/YqgF family)
MKLKVIKAIKGLVPGDILEYNKEWDRYEIYKVTEDISDNKESKRTLRVTIMSYMIEEFKDYFQTVEDDLTPIDTETIGYKDSSSYGNDCIKEVALSDSEVEILKKEVESLKKQLEEYKQPKQDGYNKELGMVYTIYPPIYTRRSFWEF